MDARYLRIATWSSVDGNIYLYLVRISSGYGLREIKRNNRFKRVNLAWHDQNRFKREFVLFSIFSLKSNL